MTALLIAAALVFSEADARLAHATARELVEQCTPRDGGTAGSARAAAFIAAASGKSGGAAKTERFLSKSPLGELPFVNVTAELPRGGAEDGWTVLVSHFDTKCGTDCPGANDGAATSGLLVALAGVIARDAAVKRNVIFLWTDGEECVRRYAQDDGLHGSRRAAAALAASGRRIDAVIVADMLGDEDLSITIPVNSSPALRRLALAAAADIGEPDLVKPSLSAVTDDHVPFAERGFPAIDLIDFEYGPKNAYWHTSVDTMAHVSEKSLLKSGRLLAAMLERRWR